MTGRQLSETSGLFQKIKLDLQRMEDRLKREEQDSVRAHTECKCDHNT